MAEFKERNDLTILKQDMQYIKEQLAAVSTTLFSSLETFKKTITDQELEISSLKATVTNLDMSINTLEQRILKNDLEIAGIPETNNENLIHIVQVTATKLGVELTSTEIDEVMRVGPKRLRPNENTSELPRTIIIKLLRKTKRDEIIQAAKSRRNLTTEDIVSGVPKKIYINERLTKHNRILFRDARQRAQRYNFRYCWIRNGNVYVREAEKKPAISILSQHDLDEKVGPFRKQSV
ncbi:hypothetical protein K1T71_001524 [Dendrolimus kikuchii]|uniref:Uncharacterized protein n=3 Tax=Dendrolimus kikuchii TaxID=765133 RepID=A0ACC1CN99_9NEOP|nr:hypothetical protein K1T71_011123 [Dendrolimus kikuchii]KAJ0181655.1 hypothetical protein K1T71_002377 [Dendrolimus kikuchii]KAJ0183548.1 hypothetical protein K1T71_001524 [Dendrolimus kikuchii]